MPQLRVRIGCVVLAVIMSAVTYYFVEPRLRWGRYGGFKAVGLLSVMVIIGVTGYSIDRHDGYTARMNDPDQPVIDAINQHLADDNKRCLSVISDWHSDENNCLMQKAPGENTIALIGDSHSRHLYFGLVAKAQDNEGVAVFPASCAAPLMGLHSGADPTALSIFPDRAKTEHLLSEAFSYILNHKNINKVVLVHNPGCSWNNVIDTLNPDNHDFGSILHDGFVRTYDALTKAGKDIYVIFDNPSYTNEFWGKCRSVAVRRPSRIFDVLPLNNNNACTLSSSERVDRKEVDNWEKIARETSAGYKNIHFIDLEQFFCPRDVCSMLGLNGEFLYMDFNHLNKKGSIYVAPFILDHLRHSREVKE